MTRRKNKKKKSLTPEQAFQELAEFCKGESLSLPVLRQKLEASPEGTIRAHGTDADSLLHYVCYNELVTLDIVEYLVDLYPESVKHAGASDGWLPLHRACLNNCCPSSVVEYLVSKYPEALSIPWPHTGLPLHCVVSRFSRRFDKTQFKFVSDGHDELDLRIVRVLVEAYPEALTNQENNGRRTPLLLACERDDVSLDLVRLLVDPELAATRLMGGYSRGLPIHCLMSEGGRGSPPLDVVQFFLDHASPETLSVRNGHSGTPFHTACRECTSLEMIQLFVKKQREVLEQEDDFGNLPLHSLCLNEKLDECTSLVKYLVEEYPDAVRTTNRYGMLPMEYAASRSLEATRFLVDQFPESVQNRDSDGRLPFHGACRHGSLETVKYLYDLYPESVAEETFFGDLPIHKAAEYSGGTSTAAKIKFLIEKHPDGVKALGRDGELPFHRACQLHRPELSLIKDLFDAFPEAIHAKNAKGCLPLHCACSEFAPAKEVIQFLVTQLPYGLRAQDDEGRTPAHYACRYFPLKELNHVIQLYPDAVRVNSQRHGLPIHYACKLNADLDVVKYLQSLYPESLDICNESVGLPLECAERRELFLYLLLERYESFFRNRGFFPLHAFLQDGKIKDKNATALRFIDFFPEHARDVNRKGIFPLHLAVTVVQDLEFINQLIELCPEAVEKQDSQGSLPLHYALRHQPPQDLVGRLLNICPRSAQVVDHQGWTPLHVACRHGASVEVVVQLMNAYPQGIRARDCHGCIPLHVACRHGTSLEVVESLINADETTLRMADTKRELPLHKACRGGHTALARYLLERNMPSVSEMNSEGKLPIVVLCQKSGKSRELVDAPEYVETIFLLLKAHPETVMSGLID